MPGKLRQQRRGGEGVPRETPETSSLPLLEAACLEMGLPKAFGLSRTLEFDGYFEVGLLAQWQLVLEYLADNLAWVADPIAMIRNLGQHEEARLRFFAPGLVARALPERPDLALQLLYEFAADSDFRVAEAVQAFGVRPIAERLGPEVVPALLPWVHQPIATRRRAAIEACRPRGVWVKRLAWTVESPAMLLPLLEPLRDEPHRFVANAVGNTLNDISKDHPRLVIDVAERWLREPPQGPHTRRIIEKAMRTLVKTGDPFALRVLGFGELEVQVQARLLNGDAVPPNTSLHFQLRVKNRGAAMPANLVYEIETTGKNPNKPRRKRYQAGTISLPERDQLYVDRRERIFDRRAAPLIDGPARARFFLNGTPVAELAFEIDRTLETKRRRAPRRAR